MGKINIDFMDAVIVGNDIWFFSMDYNGLFSVNMDTEEIVFRGQVPWEEEMKNGLYNSICATNKKIYLIPFMATQMAVYDIETSSFKAVKIGDAEKSQNYAEAILHDDKIFMFNYYNPYIGIVDINREEVCIIDSFQNKIKDIEIEDETIWFRKQPILIDDIIYMPCAKANAIVQIDCKSKDCQVNILGKEKQGYAGACLVEEEIWLLPRKGKQHICVCDTKTMNGYRKQTLQQETDLYYVGIEKIGEQIWIFSNQTREKSAEENLVCVKNHKHLFVKRCGEYVITLDNEEGTLYLYQGKSGECIRHFPVCFDKKFVKQLLKKKTLSETTNFRIVDLLEEINELAFEEKTVEQNIGKCIFETI